MIVFNSSCSCKISSERAFCSYLENNGIHPIIKGIDESGISQYIKNTSIAHDYVVDLVTSLIDLGDIGFAKRVYRKSHIRKILLMSLSIYYHIIPSNKYKKYPDHQEKKNDWIEYLYSYDCMICQWIEGSSKIKKNLFPKVIDTSKCEIRYPITGIYGDLYIKQPTGFHNKYYDLFEPS